MLYAQRNLLDNRSCIRIFYGVFTVTREHEVARANPSNSIGRGETDRWQLYKQGKPKFTRGKRRTTMLGRKLRFLLDKV